MEEGAPEDAGELNGEGSRCVGTGRGSSGLEERGYGGGRGRTGAGRNGP